MTVPARTVVGVDGSDNSTRALAWAAALVEGTDGEIVAVHALGLLTHLEDGSVVPSMGQRDQVVTLLEQQWCRPLIEASVAHRCVVVDGDPVTALLRTAREEEADLLVVGCRGTGGHPGLVLGSTSQQVVSQADRPVVVVPFQAPGP
ncbi:MAG: universal stress protein [Acidimicrobiales bacterium]|jgi:nucleotide-binding universal stress UspA family protein